MITNKPPMFLPKVSLKEKFVCELLNDLNLESFNSRNEYNYQFPKENLRSKSKENIENDETLKKNIFDNSSLISIVVIVLSLIALVIVTLSLTFRRCKAASPEVASNQSMNSDHNISDLHRYINDFDIPGTRVTLEDRMIETSWV